MFQRSPLVFSFYSSSPGEASVSVGWPESGEGELESHELPSSVPILRWPYLTKIAEDVVVVNPPFKIQRHCSTQLTSRSCTDQAKNLLLTEIPEKKKKRIRTEDSYIL